MIHRNGTVVVHALVFGAVMLAVTLAGRGLVLSSRTAVRGLAESRVLVRAARSAIAEAVAHLERELARGADLSVGQQDSVAPAAARSAFATGARVEIGAVRVSPVRAPDAMSGNGGLVDLIVTVRSARGDRSSTVTTRYAFGRGACRLRLDPMALATFTAGQ